MFFVYLIFEEAINKGALPKVETKYVLSINGQTESYCMRIYK